MTDPSLNIDLQSFLANAPIAVAVFDREMRYVAVSRHWLDEFSLESPDIIGRSHYEVFPELSEDLKALHRRSLNGEVFSGKDDPFERQNGEIQWLHWAMAPWSDSDGAIGGIVIYSIDNTVHKQAELEHRNSAQLWESIIENVPNMIFLKRASDLRYEYLNRAVETFFGLDRDQVIGRGDRDFFPAEQADFFIGKDKEALAQRGVVDIQEEVIAANDGFRTVRTKKVALRDDAGVPSHLLGISEDITGLKIAEQALLDKQSQYRSAIETSPNGFWVLDMDGRIVDVNEAYVRISGYTREELIGMQVYEIDVMQRAEEGSARAKEILQLGFAHFESMHRKKDGSRFPVEILASHSHTHGGRYFVFVTDLTERNFKNETMKFQAEILGQLKEGIHIVQVSTRRIVFTTPVFDTMFGYQKGALLGKDVSVLNAPLPEISPEKTAEFINNTLGKNGRWQGEVNNIRKDGSELICWVRVSTFDHHEYGRVWVAIHEDITERKRAEYDVRKVRESAYRDVLVREVHHRIKNNLQGVIGLLSMALADDRPAAEAVVTAIRQIKSIAVLHGLQGQTEDGTVYLSDLSAAIVQSMEMTIQRVLPLDIPTNCLSYEIIESECVPVALILNELLTNAVKHGSEQEDVAVHLEASEREGGVTITISNTGAIAPDFALNKADYLGTGLNLVSALMPHKGARVHWAREGERVLATLELRSPVIRVSRRIEYDRQ